MTKLLFLHSWGSGAFEWEPVRDLVRDGVEIVLLDLPGMNGAPPLAPSEGETRLGTGEYADWLTGEVSGYDKYFLVGHSMGGKVAMLHASRADERLSGLILIAPSPLSPEPMTDEDRERTLLSHGNHDAAAETTDRITASPLPSGVRDRVISGYLQTSSEAWRDWMLRGSREDYSAAYDDIRVPTLLIVGDKDPVISAEFAREEILPRLHLAQMEVLPGVGHLSPLEAPALVANEILDFVHEVSGTGYGLSK